MLIDMIIDMLIDMLIDALIGMLIDMLIDALIGILIDMLNGMVIGTLIDMLVGMLMLMLNLLSSSIIFRSASASFKYRCLIRFIVEASMSLTISMDFWFPVLRRCLLAALAPLMLMTMTRANRKTEFNFIMIIVLILIMCCIYLIGDSNGNTLLWER